jgi:capsular exopolysaccharide synthesis family protein
MLALGLITGLGLGTALALIRDHFDDSLRSPVQLRRHTGLETLALLPKLTTRKDIIDAPGTAQALAIRGLRNELRDSTVQACGRSLLVTSALAGEGKTTTALDLAQAIALAGERVLLIDADVAGRGLTRRIAPKAQQGLAEVLNGTAALHDVLLKDPRSGLEALPLVIRANAAAPRPSSGDIARLLQQAKAGFDVVVFDGPAVLGDAGARIIAESCDEVVLVVRSGKTPQGAVSEALQRLRATPARLRGAVLTGADASAAKRYGQG